MTCSGPNDAHDSPSHMERQAARWPEHKAENLVRRPNVHRIPGLTNQDEFLEKELIPIMKVMANLTGFRPTATYLLGHKKTDSKPETAMLMVCASAEQLRDPRWQCFVDMIEYGAEVGSLKPFDKIEVMFCKDWSKGRTHDDPWTIVL